MNAATSIGIGGGYSHRWRVLVAVPPAGLEGQFAIMRGWLDMTCGAHGWSASPAGLDGVLNDAVAFYFTDRAIAVAFVERFACGYRAAVRPGYNPSDRTGEVHQDADDRAHRRVS